MTETKKKSPLLTVELATEEESLLAIYDKVAAAEKAAADDSRSAASYVEMLWPTIFESRVTYLKK